MNFQKAPFFIFVKSQLGYFLCLTIPTGDQTLRCSPLRFAPLSWKLLCRKNKSNFEWFYAIKRIHIFNQMIKQIRNTLLNNPPGPKAINIFVAEKFIFRWPEWSKKSWVFSCLNWQNFSAVLKKNLSVRDKQWNECDKWPLWTI